MDNFSVVCCVYCYMNCEEKFARMVKDVSVIVPYKIRREKQHGKWVDNKIKMVPGYAFVYADTIEQIQSAVKDFNIKLLSYSDNKYELSGSDLEFARWIWNNNGVIGISTAVQENGKVKIVSGALKESEGMIIKLDRRHKLAKVALNIGFSVWLSYDWLDNF